MKCPPCNNNCNQGDSCPARICQGKHKYPTMELANMVTSRKQGAKSVAYKCDYCAYFHVKDSDDQQRKMMRVKQ